LGQGERGTAGRPGGGVSAAIASVSLVPWIGAGVAVYAAVLAAAVLLCAAGHEDDAAVAAPDPGGPGDDLTPERLVAHVAHLLDADAALFGWDPRAEAPRLLAASRPAFASGAEGRHLAREAVVAGRPAGGPPLHVAAAPGPTPPVALAVPAAHCGALCVSRPATRPFSGPERGRLAELGLLAAGVLREQPPVPSDAPVRGVPA